MIYGYATKSWQVVKGCNKDLPCAVRCWAKRECHRMAWHPNRKISDFHAGLTTSLGNWTGTVRLNEAHLTDPHHWRKPEVIAAAYHGDLFLAPDEVLAKVFAVMALCPQHTFLLLTKRPERMREWSADNRTPFRVQKQMDVTSQILNIIHGRHWKGTGLQWPLSNVFAGVSLTNQPDADERMGHLRKFAAMGWNTWISLEPMIAPVSFRWANSEPLKGPRQTTNHLDGLRWPKQVVLGGESGPGARPFDFAWARSVIEQCRAARVPCFVKQMGSAPYSLADRITHRGCKLPISEVFWRHLSDSHGADPLEWPAALRVRELAWGRK